MQKSVIKVAVVSDVVCPWCYIGKRRLEKAMDMVSDRFDFEVEYFPFELNPQIPAGGIDQKAYLTSKFGSDAKYEQLTGHVTRIAAGEGIVFDYAAQRVSPNTRDAHRLIQLAGEAGLQAQLVEAFYKAYFTDGVDLSRKENLISVAAGAGMDPDKTALFLDSNTGTVEVEMAEKELHQLGISGVPFFIIDNKYGISGAQSPEAFIKAFEEIGAPPAGDAGQQCDVDGKNC